MKPRIHRTAAAQRCGASQRTPGRHLLGFVLAMIAVGCTPQPQGPTVEKFVETRAVMSTLATITLISNSSARAVEATEAGFAALDSVVALMNAHAAQGDLAQVNASAGRRAVPVAPATFAVLQQALAISSQSGGAFDVTVGPLIALWRRCAEEQRLPTDRELETARSRTGYQQVELDTLGRTVRYAAAGMRIDLGGIAKGYAIDRAVAAIRASGIEDGIVEVGGDLRCFGQIPAALVGRSATLPVRTLRRRAADAGAPESRSAPLGDVPDGFFPGLRRTEKVSLESRQAWPLGVQDPFGEELLGKMRVPAGGVATSGHYRRYTEIQGQRYSHIIDPRTGQPVADPASVTVVAPDALTADALATALTVLGAQAGLALAESLPEVEALIIAGRPAAPELAATSGFPEILEVAR